MKLEDLEKCLISGKESVPSLKAVTGFDGFVDEMITVVDERTNLEAYKRVEDISLFGDLVKQAAGHSSLREIVVTATHPGGCAVNMGDGLAALGVTVDTFATLGNPIHPSFTEYGKKATLHSWGREPGRTLAFEFADGKLMFSAVSQLAEFAPDRVHGFLEDGTFSQACEAARLIALTNWSLYPHMTAVWDLLNESVFAKLAEQPLLFIDLVDPASRNDTDVAGMLDALRRLGETSRVVLGLNQNEANILSRILGLETLAATDHAGTEAQAREIHTVLGIDSVVVHTHSYAAAASGAGVISVDGPYCPNPKKSTGAGDRFNAGYALGLMLNLPVEACLLVASASSGFFVRNARSAGIDELATFVGQWASGDLE